VYYSLSRGILIMAGRPVSLACRQDKNRQQCTAASTRRDVISSPGLTAIFLLHYTLSIPVIACTWRAERK